MSSRRFSQSLNLPAGIREIQRESMDERLTNRLWSVLTEIFFEPLSEDSRYDREIALFIYRIWDYFLALPTDQMPILGKAVKENLSFWFRGAHWNEKYDLIQFLADFSNLQGDDYQYANLRKRAQDFCEICNIVLEQEKSAYRFVKSTLTELVDENEIKAITESLDLPDGLSGAKVHIAAALKLYSDRDRPDYRNSIKESISAVESAFFAINQQRSNSLGDALKLAEKQGMKLHPAFRTGILNLYGYTSDQAGVRHALLDQTVSVGSHEAKLMLVLCSGLVNFLATKMPASSIQS